MTTAVAEGVQTRFEWLAIVSSHRQAPTGSRPALASSDPEWSLYVEGGENGALARHSAQATRTAVVFDGVLYNRQELAAELDLRTTLSDAELLLQAYERWGEKLTGHIKGIFALLIWDAAERRLFGVRDPLGAYPLFYAHGAGGRLLLSTSMDSLVRHRSVDSSVNRAALADHLCHRWPYPSETFYNAVKRVPGGCQLVATPQSTHVNRYWDPAPPGQPINFVSEEELEGFDRRLETAVARATGQGRPGIFLSGGLDSISVAALATDLARRSGGPTPVALSLGFPHPDINEEPIQRAVAESLGIPQEFVPFFDAVPAQGLLASALEYTRTSPAPTLNTWSPAYTNLALRGKRRGVEVVLSGAGGDEWLAVSPYLAADLIRSRDINGLWKLLRAWRRSYQMTPWQVLRGTFWTFGVRPLAGAVLHNVAPQAWHANRLRRLRRTTRQWVAPDTQLRRELDRRTEDILTPAAPASGFYFNDVRMSLEHPLTSMELEGIFEMGQRLGLRFLHPYWDADVVDMLYRTPPRLLSRDGRAKGLVRETVARRFPRLGLDRQKKLAGTSFYKSVLADEIPRLWKSAGGRAPTLAALGIVDPREIDVMVEAILSDPSREGLGRIWDVLNLDAWVESRPRYLRQNG